MFKRIRNPFKRIGFYLRLFYIEILMDIVELKYEWWINYPNNFDSTCKFLGEDFAAAENKVNELFEKLGFPKRYYTNWEWVEEKNSI